MSGESETPPSAKSPQQEKQSPAVLNWVNEALRHFHQQFLRINKTMNDPESPSKLAIKLMYGLTADVQTRFSSYLATEGLRHPLWGDLFDNSRKGFRKVVSNLLTDRELKRVIGEEETARWGRSFYARFIKSLLNQSQSGSNEFSGSFKGAAWSILARDINDVMVPCGQPPISSKWKTRMAGLINSRSLDMRRINQELNRFVSGDPAVFRAG